MEVLTITDIYNLHPLEPQDYLCRKVNLPQPHGKLFLDYFEMWEQLCVCAWCGKTKGEEER